MNSTNPYNKAPKIETKKITIFAQAILWYPVFF